VSDCCLALNEQFLAISSCIRWENIRCVLYNRPICVVDFYSVSSLKQQSASRHVVQLWNIILISRQLEFYSYYLMIKQIWKNINTSFLWTLIWPTQYSNPWSTAPVIIVVHVQLTPRSICIVGMQSRCINQSGKQEEEHKLSKFEQL
jgi:hypothetical protein